MNFFQDRFGEIGWIHIFIGVVIVVLAYQLVASGKKVSFVDKHCLITGGSSGLGKAIAVELLAKGAHVTLVARNKAQLEEAARELAPFKTGKKQQIYTVSADVTNYESIKTAISEAESLSGPISALFSCAGSSKPGFFLEQSIEDFEAGMKLNYFGTLNSVKAASMAMIKSNQRDGRIIMVSSTLGLMGMIGYSQYSPTKFALRSLAECLRQELLPYGIGVSIYFVSTIASPGYEKENLTKPAITKMIEDGDPSDPSPKSRAKTLIRGIERNQFFITSDIITDIFRVMASGISPWNSPLDPVLHLLGQIIIPFWRKYSDYLVLREHKKSK